jgi:hypothetical protein
MALAWIGAATALAFGGCGGGSSSDTSTTPATTASTASVASTSTAPPSEPSSTTTPQIPHGAVAIVGHHVITKTMLREWMKEQAGEVFHLDAQQRKAPTGLISEPANYPRCIAAIQAFAPNSGQTPTQLKYRCENLYAGLKKEALNHLVGSYWTIDFAAAHGIHITTTELKQALERAEVENQTEPGGFQGVLRSRSRTLPQEQFLLKTELISSKLLPKLLAGPTSPIGKEALANATTATCPREYLVEHCAGYKEATATPQVHPSVAATIEEIGHWQPKT